MKSEKLRTEDEIARYYWPRELGAIPAWFRSAISDAFDTGIAFAVRGPRQGPEDVDCREAQDNTPSKGPF